MSTPLAMQGDKQIDIRWEQEPFFSGRLRDVSSLYVVAATALSIGAGISAAAVCGWRHSARKSSEIKLELSSLEQNLQQKEELLRELKLSDNRLQLSGLSSFLDDGVPFEQAVNSQKFKTSVSQPVVTQTPAPILNSVPSVPARQSTNRMNTPISAASAFASAQNGFGYAHNSSNGSKQTVVASEVNKTTITASDFEEMQQQLREEMQKQFQQMMFQMQAMQNHRQLVPQATSTAATVSDKFSVYYEAPSTSEVRFK
ncbi:MAG: hypothetical protein KME60_02575 [Cyanomargarita calcarea GSE-NOS-MK-12-04C]|uniref:Uncharacterized protein n=1 Tax=Cyanomargarita calcarea GSE-NOS-MK-12-04C TaxID=2839659 RepID=A0A951UR59_9CYAN|nr:hypothetical protein [Cyanomargarita calcarea GSE-NOS-MK-12-04C]